GAARAPTRHPTRRRPEREQRGVPAPPSRPRARRRGLMAGAAAPLLLLADIDEPGLGTREVYERRGGYESLRKALSLSPEEVLASLEASGLRGRGGAGFAMGKKVSFLPKGSMDKY